MLCGGEDILHQLPDLHQGKLKIYYINLLWKYHKQTVDQQAHLLAMALTTEVEGEEADSVEYPLKPCETYRDVVIIDFLRTQQIKRFQRIVAETATVLTDKPGLTDLLEFDMKLTSAEPVRIRPYPTRFAKEEALKAELDYLLKESIISPCESPYSAPVVLLRKPSGEHRLCIDYRQLNKITEFQPEPLPEQGQPFARQSTSRRWI